jgi:hypothetical protein
MAFEDSTPGEGIWNSEINTSANNGLGMPRTVSEYYEAMAKESPSDSIARRIETMGQLEEERARLTGIGEGLPPAPKTSNEYFDNPELYKKVFLNEGAAAQNTREITHLARLNQDEKDDFDNNFHYYGDSPREGNLKGFASATQVSRLNEISDANKPLPGQDPRYRLADLTPEMVHERKEAMLESREKRLSRESSTDISSSKEPKREAENEREQREKKAMERFALFMIEKHYPRIFCDPRIYKYENLALYYISKNVFLGKEGNIPLDDIEKGIPFLNHQLEELKESSGNGNESSEIKSLEERIDNVAEINNEVNVLYAMWYAGNQITNTINPYKHFDTEKYLDLKDKMKSFDGIQLDPSKKPFSEYSTDLKGLGSEYVLGYMIMNDITTFCGKKDVSELVLEDIPGIMAYLTNTDNWDYFNSVYLGADLCLKTIMTKEKFDWMLYDEVTRKMEPYDGSSLIDPEHFFWYFLKDIPLSSFVGDTKMTVSKEFLRIHRGKWEKPKWIGGKQVEGGKE